jgi:hypothetical protein
MLDRDQRLFNASLRIFGDELDLAAATRTLGLEPSSTGRIGEHINGNSRYAKYDTNVWVYSYAETFRSPFSEQLSEYVARLEERAEAVRALLSRPGVTAELFLGFSSSNGQGGFTLPASLLARIAALGLDVSLDLYPPTADEV